MKFLSEEEMKKLTAPRLLAYRNKLLKVNDSDVRESAEWENAYQSVKLVLNTKEHVTKK